MKGWVSVLVAVFAADYTMLAGAYGVFIFVASKIQERQNTATGNLSPESMFELDGNQPLINEDYSDVEGDDHKSE